MGVNCGLEANGNGLNALFLDPNWMKNGRMDVRVNYLSLLCYSYFFFPLQNNLKLHIFSALSRKPIQKNRARQKKVNTHDLSKRRKRTRKHSQNFLLFASCPKGTQMTRTLTFLSRLSASLASAHAVLVWISDSKSSSSLASASSVPPSSSLLLLLDGVFRFSILTASSASFVLFGATMLITLLILSWQKTVFVFVQHRPPRGTRIHFSIAGTRMGSINPYAGSGQIFENFARTLPLSVRQQFSRNMCV